MPFLNISRRQLYDLIWARPMRDVAAELGISDVGLRAVCERHRVPIPPRGYWNHAPERRPKKAIFVDVQEPYLNRVQIRGALTALPETTRAILEKSKCKKRQLPSLLPNVQLLPQTDPVGAPHPLIKGTIKALKAASADERGTLVVEGPGIVAIEAGPNCQSRIAAFLSNLASILEARGRQLSQTEKGLALGAAPDLIYFRIVELTKRINHVATTEEIERSEASKKAAQKREGSVWIFDYWTPPKYDWTRNGALSFRIDRYSAPYRRQWTDGTVQTLESMLDDIAGGLIAAFEVEKSERIDREWRSENEHRARRRSELKSQWDLREKERRRFLDELEASQRRADFLKSWLEKQPPTPDGPRGRLLSWARHELSSLTEQIKADSVTREIERRAIFPQPDQLEAEIAELERPVPRPPTL